MNRDQLNSVHHIPAVRAAYAQVSGVQGLPAVEQIAGAAVLFTEMCDQLGLDPSQLIDASRRRTKNFDDTIHMTEVRSLRAYINGELRK